VPPTSHAWDEDRRDGEPSRWTVAGGVALSPPELDVLPGEPDPFEPSAEDLADYAAWSATLPHGMA